ncbi:hypothetical protein MTR_8g062650 [Medicago truncatula]|uniref:Uncharacterized protein n=1 Tax=Medicago truncatula TaxID=3880 RepID=G7LEP7_MEDTR|nr:hypothetical protein MTR_8g062650 [Medicago truncatula]
MLYLGPDFVDTNELISFLSGCPRLETWKVCFYFTPADFVTKVLVPPSSSSKSSISTLFSINSAHDILDDAEAAGSPMGFNMYILHSSAYQKEGMQREAKARLKQMKKINLQKELSDNAIDKHTPYEETLNSVGKSNLAITLAQVLKDENQTVITLTMLLWGGIKRFTKNNYLVVNRDLYELLLLNFIRGG